MDPQTEFRTPPRWRDSDSSSSSSREQDAEAAMELEIREDEREPTVVLFEPWTDVSHAVEELPGANGNKRSVNKTVDRSENRMKCRPRYEKFLEEGHLRR